MVKIIQSTSFYGVLIFNTTKLTANFAGLGKKQFLYSKNKPILKYKIFFDFLNLCLIKKNIV